MNRTLISALTLALCAGAAFLTHAADPQPKVAHMVFFSLKDKSEPAKAALVAACDKYLKGHPGEVHYSAGTIASEFNRDVNDRDFDVSLHLVFRTKADHDRYQDAARHKQFIAENQANWAKVRVFDSYVK